MVTRIISGTSIRGLLNYNESKVGQQSAQLIMAGGFGLDISQIDNRAKLTRFEHLTKLNSRVKTNALHIMLNFDASDKINTTKLQQIASRYMEGIGFGSQPFLVYRHYDVSHPHIHLVTTNIRPDGSRIDLHNIGRGLSEKTRVAIELDFGLVKAAGRGKDWEKKIKPAKLNVAQYGITETKRSVYNVVTAIVRSYAFSSLAEFNAVLQEFNVLADRGKPNSAMFEKRGLVYSVTDDQGKRIGIPFKASALAGRPILEKIEHRFEKNSLKKKALANPLRQAIDSALKKHDALTKQAFHQALAKQNIAVLFRENEQGRIYGVTFIDHRNRTVFNGSDLGKAYSAKAILERLDILNQQKVTKVAPVLTARADRSKRTSLALIPQSNEPKTHSSGVLDILLTPADFKEGSEVMKKRKKKKKKGIDQGQQI